MNKLEAIWSPYFEPRIRGLSKELGLFWISNENNPTISIKIVTPADEHYSRNSGYFASFNVHYDGFVTMRALDECGFLRRFEETQAQTFYDVFYCLHASGIPVRSHDPDKQLIASRKMYELLTREPDSSELERESDPQGKCE